jgi:predicted methyltransferase
MKSLITACIAVLTLLTGSVQALDAGSLAAALSNSASRADADKARDAGRKPAYVVEFLGIDEGMTVIDLIAAAGYYTEVLSHAVGASGTVYMQNPPASLTGERGARTAGAIDTRLANNRLANVERLNRDFSDLGLARNSVDAAILALEMHEMTNSGSNARITEFLSALFAVLKPGGILGVIEHSSSPDNDNTALHRGSEVATIAAAEAAGFTVVATSNLLRNPEDDRSKMVFDSSVRGKTDRFVLKLQKP